MVKLSNIFCNTQTVFSQFPMEHSILKIPTLPLELIIEILSRIPVKSLLKFTCVLKSWLDLISSPDFIKSHLEVSANNKDNTHHRLMLCYCNDDNFKDWSLSSLLYEPDKAEESDSNYPIKNLKKSYHSMDSVNGLICLVNESDDLYLWNPSIRKYKKLPDSTINSTDVSHSVYGVGYDKFHDNYKVVGHTYYLGYLRDVDAQIYSLKSDSWRSISYLLNGVTINRPGRFVDGNLYWVNSNSTERNIIYIDLVYEKWEKMELPSFGEGDNDLWLGVLGSDLSVCIDNEGKHASVTMGNHIV
ncbi:hypothetical protein P3L10_011375 [Capsicum annuum]